ncbi:MAG TPA: UbiA family prenyltransferase [Candidatus Lokiarchaeia archaeon]
MARLLFEYAKLIRLTGLGGLSLAPVFGALSLVDIGTILDLRIIGLLLLLGIFKSIFGFVQNDYADIDLDRLSDETKTRPLVTGTISKKAAIVVCAICFIGTFIIVFTFFYKNQPSFYIGVLCILLSALFGSIYNFYGKKFYASPFIAALADALYVLVGAFFISSTITLSIFTWVIFILIYNQFLFMTIVVGGVKDADHDYLMNVKNLALASGVKVTKDKKVFIPLMFKAFGLGIRLISSFVLFIPFLFYGKEYQIWEIIILTLLVVSVLFLTVKLMNIKSLEKRDEVLKLAGLQGILRFAFVPFLLLPLIGLIYTLLLLLFPLIWYIISTPFIGKKLFKQLM